MKILLLGSLLLAVPFAASAQEAVLVSVNGVPIQKTAALDRTWKTYGTTVLNQMADEILIKQAADSLKVKVDNKEVDARLKRIRDQFKDEATFKAQLETSGTSLAAVRAQLEDQVLREALIVKAKSLSTSDAEVKQAFEANKEKLSTSDAVRLRHLLVGTEKEANDFLVAIRAGADFGKLASQVSQDTASKDRGGDLGFIAKGLVIPEIEKAAFALKPGEVSPVIRTQLGFHIVKVEETRKGKAATFKDVEKDLKTAVMAEKITKAWPGYLQELRDRAKYESPAAATASPNPGK